MTGWSKSTALLSSSQRLQRADVGSRASMALMGDGKQCAAAGGIGAAKLIP
jgi:hypothetical protein